MLNPAEWIRRIGDKAASAFKADGDDCTICRSPLPGGTGDTDHLGLCVRCRSSIPWIRPQDIRCAVCGRPEECPDCPRRTDPAFRCNRSAVRYTGEMKNWLSRLKYRGDERMGALFAAMAGGALERLMAEYGLRQRDIDCLACVPLSGDRLAERGFNQTELIARRLAEHYRIPFVPLLARLRHTGKMSEKSRIERLRNLEGAFVCADLPIPSTGRLNHAKPGQSGRPTRIVLVDDVYTTGSTMQECSKAILQRYPAAEVYGLTWAR